MKAARLDLIDNNVCFSFRLHYRLTLNFSKKKRNFHKKKHFAYIASTIAQTSKH